MPVITHTSMPTNRHCLLEDAVPLQHSPPHCWHTVGALQHTAQESFVIALCCSWSQPMRGLEGRTELTSLFCDSQVTERNVEWRLLCSESPRLCAAQEGREWSWMKHINTYWMVSASWAQLCVCVCVSQLWASHHPAPPKDCKFTKCACYESEEWVSLLAWLEVDLNHTACRCWSALFTYACTHTHRHTFTCVRQQWCLVQKQTLWSLRNPSSMSCPSSEC